MKRYATLAVLFAALMSAGCANTVRGIGQDVNQTANAVEDAVD